MPDTFRTVSGIPELKLLFFQTFYEWIVGLGIFSIQSLVESIDLCTF
jgi:hypothetical protein